MKQEDYETLSKTERIFADLMLEMIAKLHQLNRAIDIEVKQ